MSSKHLKALRSLDAELADRLEKDDTFRRRFIRFWAQAEVAAQIRDLRKARRMLQADVAKLAATGQSAISRIEKADYDGWTFKTLIGIAEVLRARLRIQFEPIEDVVGQYRELARDNGIASILAASGTANDTIPEETQDPVLPPSPIVASGTVSGFQLH